MTTIDERTELLISRAVAGDAAGAEWDELTVRADADPSVWREVGATLRDHCALSRIADDAGRRADAVAPAAPPARRGVGVWRSSLGLASWAGWAVAAGLAIAIAGGRLDPAPERSAPVAQSPAAPVAGTTLVHNAQDALEAYLEKGRAEDRVIRQMPRMVLLETRPNPAGDGIEILYLRQLMERAVVPDLFEFGGQDEAGRPELIRYRQPAGGGM